MTNMRTPPAGGRPGPERPDHVRLSGPVDLIAIVPYLLGFHPADSVVALAIRAKRPIFAARIDLPPAGASRAEIRDLVEPLPETLACHGATGVLLVGYGPADRATPVIAAARAVLRPTSITVIEALRVSGGRFWSYLCADRDCCPADGTPYDASTSAAAAAATVAGMVALPDRQALIDQVGPVGGRSRLAMRQATAAADDRLLALVEQVSIGPTDPGDAPDGVAAAVWAAGRQALAGALDRHREGGRLTDEEAAWLSLLVSLIPLRDLAWQQIIDDPASVRVHQELWLDVMRRAQPDLVAAPGCLLAFCAWVAGHEVLASAALERVRLIDPEYSMARTLRSAMASGVPPQVLFGDPKRRVRSRLGGPRRRRSSSRRARTPRA
jgi:hypothetical protein